MIYKVALYRSEEGYSVSVPGLPGCCSQGATEADERMQVLGFRIGGPVGRRALTVGPGLAGFLEQLRNAFNKRVYMLNVHDKRLDRP